MIFLKLSEGKTSQGQTQHQRFEQIRHFILRRNVARIGTGSLHNLLSIATKQRLLNGL